MDARVAKIIASQSGLSILSVDQGFSDWLSMYLTVRPLMTRSVICRAL